MLGSIAASVAAGAFTWWLGVFLFSIFNAPSHSAPSVFGSYWFYQALCALLPAARGDMLRRLSRWAEAEDAYRDARMLVVNDAERRFLDRRLAEMQQRSGRKVPTA